jgi:hypothetical protein
MLDNKRAQIGDTMTWVVATLVIVVILGILVFATTWISGNKSIYLEDKEKDFLATKSITSFLRHDYNIGLLESESYEILKTKLKILLVAISPYDLKYLVKPGDVAHPGIGAWGIELMKDDQNKIRIYCNEISSRNLAAPFLLTTNINLGELKLNFGVDECFK